MSVITVGLFWLWCDKIIFLYTCKQRSKTFLIWKRKFGFWLSTDDFLWQLITHGQLKSLRRHRNFFTGKGSSSGSKSAALTNSEGSLGKDDAALKEPSESESLKHHYHRHRLERLKTLITQATMHTRQETQDTLATSGEDDKDHGPLKRVRLHLLCFMLRITCCLKIIVTNSKYERNPPKFRQKRRQKKDNFWGKTNEIPYVKFSATVEKSIIPMIYRVNPKQAKQTYHLVNETFFC